MVVPHEVPAGPRVFVNRTPDFEWMRVFLTRTPGSGRIGVCSGLPGVGKTAFVRRCVERAQADGVFADGELHVDFGSVDGERMSVADAMAACLRALGIQSEVIPATLAERANRLRSLTAEKSVLIVLENVTDSAQVLPFVPNSRRSAVLVTSIGQLSELLLDEADFHRLEPLDGVAGAHLIAEIIGARAYSEAGAVSELVRHCAGLPVALSVVAAKLRARPGLRIDSVVASITSDARGLAPFSVAGGDKVSAVFSEAYAGLPQDAALLYRLLGLFPGQDLEPDTIRALLRGDAGKTDAAVAALIEAGVLTEDSTQRLALHSMLKRHAAQLSREIDSDRVREDADRAVTHHLVIKAAFADLAVLGERRYRCTPAGLCRGRESPFGDDRAQARRAGLDWLDAERLNLLAVQRMAADRGWHDWAWQLAEALTAVYVTRRYYTEWTVSSEIGAAAAHAAGHARAEARLRSFVSRAWIERERLDRAQEELIVKALPLAEAAGDGRLLASVWEFVGRFLDAADPDRAGAAYRRSLELFAGQNDSRGRAFVLFFLARTERRSGDIAQAAATMQAALAAIRDVGDPRMEGRALIDVSEMLDELGGHRRARETAREAADVLAASGDAFYEAQAQEQCLRLAAQDNDGDGQRASLSRMVQIHRELGSDRVGELEEMLRRLTDRP